jgi:Ulp1 family protease
MLLNPIVLAIEK